MSYSMNGDPYSNEVCSWECPDCEAKWRDDPSYVICEIDGCDVKCCDSCSVQCFDCLRWVCKAHRVERVCTECVARNEQESAA